MESIKKICVAMICHFSNSEVRGHLQLEDNRWLYTFSRKLLGMQTKNGSYGDIAPWDTSTIKFLREREDIDLYVISAHSGLKKRIISFESIGVHYSFVRCEVATMLKRIIPNDEWWRKLNPMLKDIHYLLADIKPDIVLLMGAENAYYSSTVLGVKDYPVYIVIQTIYNNPERLKFASHLESKNATTEMKIFKEHRYFGTSNSMHFDLLRRLSPNSFIFHFGFPSSGMILEPSICEKKYDFVNYALVMSTVKGFTDAIEALGIVKKRFSSVTLNLVGGGSEEQKADLQKLAKKCGVEDNITFTPFFEKQSDMFMHIQQARYAVLPCKLDYISGTQEQAMQLGLPLVAYRTAGTPDFNKEKECALLAEHSNVEDLAKKMMVLLENPKRTGIMKMNAREYQERKVEWNRDNGGRLVKNLKAVIAHWRDGTPIPKEQLFETEMIY